MGDVVVMSDKPLPAVSVFDQYYTPNEKHPVYRLAIEYGVPFVELKEIWERLAKETSSDNRVTPESVLSLWAAREAMLATRCIDGLTKPKGVDGDG
jgi:hypothetical protein